MNKFNLKTIINPFFLLIFSALLFATLTDQFLQKQIENMIRSKDGLTNTIWLWGFLSILSAVLFPLLISMLCAFALVAGNKKIAEFLAENLELGFIETLRACGKIFLWSFLFLIPGVIKYINYILTPFVVIFSRRYKNGEVDALEYSTKISRNFWLSIKMWLGVFYLLIPILFYTLFDQYRLFDTHPVSATAIVFLDSLLELLFHFIILRLFIKFLNESEVPNGAHV